jgi:hypothetical protein
MSEGNGTMSGQPNNIFATFAKFGFAGVISAVLLYFVYYNMTVTNSVITENTKALVDFKAVGIQVKDAVNASTDVSKDVKAYLKRR